MTEKSRNSLSYTFPTSSRERVKEKESSSSREESYSSSTLPVRPSAYLWTGLGAICGIWSSISMCALCVVWLRKLLDGPVLVDLLGMSPPWPKGGCWPLPRCWFTASVGQLGVEGRVEGGAVISRSAANWDVTWDTSIGMILSRADLTELSMWRCRSSNGWIGHKCCCTSVDAVVRCVLASLMGLPGDGLLGDLHLCVILKTERRKH